MQGQCTSNGSSPSNSGASESPDTLSSRLHGGGAVGFAGGGLSFATGYGDYVGVGGASAAGVSPQRDIRLQPMPEITRPAEWNRGLTRLQHQPPHPSLGGGGLHPSLQQQQHNGSLLHHHPSLNGGGGLHPSLHHAAAYGQPPPPRFHHQSSPRAGHCSSTVTSGALADSLAWHSQTYHNIQVQKRDLLSL
jgi:hypothetical protein